MAQPLIVAFVVITAAGALAPAPALGQTAPMYWQCRAPSAGVEPGYCPVSAANPLPVDTAGAGSIAISNIPNPTDTGAGAAGASTLRVITATNSPVQLSAGTALAGKVGIDQTTAGVTNGVQDNQLNTNLLAATIPVGLLQTKTSTALQGTVLAVKASAGVLDWIYVRNPDVAGNAGYLECWDVASGSVVLGTTVPKIFFYVAAGYAGPLQFPSGLDTFSFLTAISCAAVTTYNGVTNAVTGFEFVALYK